MNLSLAEVNGEVLAIPQFTLYAQTRKGNRPSYIDAAEPRKAKALYLKFIEYLLNLKVKTKSGFFGEHMQVTLTNDGPVTIVIDSSERKQSRKDKNR